jgi:predicted DNA-binding transcriptional regulator AlpA
MEIPIKGGIFMPSQEEAKLLTLPQLSSETQIPLSWLYERSRRDALPGMVRLGKYVRIDPDEFYIALKEGRVR